MLEYLAMNTGLKDLLNNSKATTAFLLALGLVVGGFAGYKYRTLNDALELSLLQGEELASKLEEARGENLRLLEETTTQQSIINSFSGQIRGISSTVGVLEKLAQTDEELLQKYSKVYFLNENYVPVRLTDIAEKYRLPSATNYLFHADAYPFLERMLEQALAEDVDILVASAFRSFDTQASLKNGYLFTYGSGANQFSADQGYSEHQLGTSVDFSTSKLGASFARFGSDPAYKWLLENAHKYGFTLSYPEGNTYYKFEPWHWRFVGVELATYLKNEGKHFYELDQRELDKYLVKLFD